MEQDQSQYDYSPTTSVEENCGSSVTRDSISSSCDLGSSFTESETEDDVTENTNKEGKKKDTITGEFDEDFTDSSVAVDSGSSIDSSFTDSEASIGEEQQKVEAQPEPDDVFDEDFSDSEPDDQADKEKDDASVGQKHQKVEAQPDDVLDEDFSDSDSEADEEFDEDFSDSELSADEEVDQEKDEVSVERHQKVAPEKDKYTLSVQVPTSGLNQVNTGRPSAYDRTIGPGAHVCDLPYKVHCQQLLSKVYEVDTWDDDEDDTANK